MLYVNMPRFLYHKTNINLLYFEYLFLCLLKRLLLWYCLKCSLLIFAYMVWCSVWSKKEKNQSLDRVLTTSWPPTEGTCNCKLCQWKTIYRYINFFNDKRPQHPSCDNSFPDQIRGIDTMPETFLSRCNWRHPLVLDPLLRRSEHSSRLSRTYNINILYDNVYKVKRQSAFKIWYLKRCDLRRCDYNKCLFWYSFT